MARNIAASRLSNKLVRGQLSFEPAGPQDRQDILRILRENPVGGRFGISMEREPDPYASDFGLSPNHLTVIARDIVTGAAAGMCERTVFNAYVDGEVRALPYIGGLRAEQNYRHRISAIKGGFEAFRVFGERSGELPFALTSITSDNQAARRLLTAGLNGLPHYSPVGEFTTFVMRPRAQTRPKGIRIGSAADIPAIVNLLNRRARQFQFTPAWTIADVRGLANHGLPAEAFVLCGEGARISGCMAVWDQTANRQVVARSYPPLLGKLRRLANMLSPISRLPSFPPVGKPMRMATLSHLAVEDDDPDIFLRLVKAGLRLAKAKRFEQVAMGMASERNLCKHVRMSLRTIEYQTMLYLVHQPGHKALVDALQPGLAQPELGLL
ncbi:MAG: hypothetical protein ABJM26_15295 [Anderseniella sp.]